MSNDRAFRSHPLLSGSKAPPYNRVRANHFLDRGLSTMPLSEHEQRILDEIERRLAEEDPKFARGVQSKTPLGQSMRRLRRAIAGFVAGLVLLVAGLLFPDAFFLFGFASFGVMLASAVVIAQSAKSIGRKRAVVPDRPRRETWFDRMEERWKKRFDKDET